MSMRQFLTFFLREATRRLSAKKPPLSQRLRPDLVSFCREERKTASLTAPSEGSYRPAKGLRNAEHTSRHTTCLTETVEEPPQFLTVVARIRVRPNSF